MHCTLKGLPPYRDLGPSEMIDAMHMFEEIRSMCVMVLKMGGVIPSKWPCLYSNHSPHLIVCSDKEICMYHLVLKPKKKKKKDEHVTQRGPLISPVAFGPDLAWASASIEGYSA